MNLDDEALNNGLILDISAAQILQAKGIDVGLEEKGETYSVDREYFVKEKRYITLDKEYKEIEFINCSGKLNGNKVELDYIAPFASLGFEVK